MAKLRTMETHYVEDMFFRELEVVVSHFECRGDYYTKPTNERVIVKVRYLGRDVTRLVDHSKVERLFNF